MKKKMNHLLIQYLLKYEFYFSEFYFAATDFNVNSACYLIISDK